MKYALIVFAFLLLSLFAKAQQEVELCPGGRNTFTYWSNVNVSNGGWLWLLNNDTVSINNNVRLEWNDTGWFNIRVFFSNECGRAEKIYKVHVIDCIEAAIFFPNAFTPNSDGINDTWVPIPRKIVEINYSIWNRWGEKVFESNSFAKKWDGRYKGEQQPIGTFVFMASWRDVNGRRGFNKGFVILIR